MDNNSGLLRLTIFDATLNSGVWWAASIVQKPDLNVEHGSKVAKKTSVTVSDSGISLHWVLRPNYNNKRAFGYTQAPPPTTALI